MTRSLLLLAALLLAGCATRPATPPALAHAGAPAGTVSVAERYVTTTTPSDELDSLATWPTEDGRVWLIATAKVADQLVVFDADSGERLQAVGGRGQAPGRFLRPNGIAVHGDLVFVSERDNRRVQVLSLPGFAPAGSFGEGELRSPYGLWLHEPQPGILEAYVTDSFMYGRRHDVVPPFAELDQRVRRYRLHVDEDRLLRAESIGAFGDTREATALRIVESIAGDPLNDRLLIADEDSRHASTLHAYTLSGRFTGNSLPPGSFLGEAEGIALWDCGNDAGYWIAADQLQPLTVFRLFDRHSLAPRGAFTGERTAGTDGISLHAAATARFPAGVLHAVHDDSAVTAFDLRDIAEALRLDPSCLR